MTYVKEPTNLMLPLGERLFEFRKQYGQIKGVEVLSYERLSALLGNVVSYQTLRRWEQGAYKNPSAFLVSEVESRLTKLETKHGIIYAE